MIVGVTYLFITAPPAQEKIMAALILVFAVLTFPFIITFFLKKVHIYLVDCIVLALLILINVDRLIVFIYYLVFLPLAFALYLFITTKIVVKTRIKEEFLRLFYHYNEYPFLFVLALAVAFAELFLFVLSYY